MEATQNENVKKDQEEVVLEEENNVKVDVVELGQPDEALLWERRFRRQGKSI